MLRLELPAQRKPRGHDPSQVAYLVRVTSPSRSTVRMDSHFDAAVGDAPAVEVVAAVVVIGAPKAAGCNPTPPA